ncbi:MAG: hypothetical protein ACFFA3_17565 [Promethearchaeota archaeon]
MSDSNEISMKNEISFIVQKVTGRSELNLEFGNEINKLGYDYTDPQMDNSINQEILKENSKKELELVEELEFAKKTNDVDNIKRYEVWLELDLPFNFKIDKSVDLSNPDVVKIIKKCKEDYLKIPARFRGKKSPEVRFIDLPSDHPTYYLMTKDKQKELDFSCAFFHNPRYGAEIAICTNGKYYTEVDFEILGSTLSPITHEFGHFVETVLGGSPDSKVIDFWKSIMRKEHLNLREFTQTRSALSAKDLFADAFMEYTTGGLRRENILYNINRRNMDLIIDIIIKMIKNGEYSNDIISYFMVQGEVLNNIEVLIYNEHDGKRKYNFYDFLENVKKNDEIIKVQSNSRFDKVTFSKNLADLIKGETDIKIYGLTSQYVIDDLIKAIRRHGNPNDFDPYLFKGYGLIDEFESIRTFFNNYIGEGFLKSSIQQYRENYISISRVLF